MSAAPSEFPRAASLVIIDPSGRRSKLEIRPVPFRIGRHADNHLVIRDSRASRVHAQISLENGSYVIDDLQSRHGLYINGQRVERQELKDSDRIDFGVPDSYQLVFTREATELDRLLKQLPAAPPAGVNFTAPGAGSDLGKLRAVLDVARVVHGAFSTDEVLASVVSAALSITKAERGFLLMRQQGGLVVRCALDAQGNTLREDDLRVPLTLIHRSLQKRRDLLSMVFDPADAQPGESVSELALCSAVCIPLLRIKAVDAEATSLLSAASDTAGVLYLDSRSLQQDLAAGNREVLQTLAIEASSVLENARLLEEERIKQKIEQELEVARNIQQSLLPRTLPSEGWFRASGSSVSSHQVGGDYFDVLQVGRGTWATVVADVAGKGVSSALLASLLQGTFLTLCESTATLETTLTRVNRFLNERTGGAKYATVFCLLMDEAGGLRYINAGHCAPMVAAPGEPLSYLETTAVPAGLMAETTFPSNEIRLTPGTKLVIYSDGVTEAQNARGEFFGRRRLRETIQANPAASSRDLHEAIRGSVQAFTQGEPQSDDITVVVLEYAG